MPAIRECPRQTEIGDRRDLGDEYIFYDPQGHKLHVLNGTAREIYLLCDGKNTIEEIAAALAKRYEVDRDTVLQDTREALERLLELGLVE